ncbi:MAG TPA: AgmX/PglI C-terminal domain-containing protein [Oligoflexia bacterium]|nr:AgmX/PglI C-terminal domain-containing protein [Oligoflexia bacterium]HMR24006.1 AgmX/PglI C-terminal domain-containing protein [Oligoflexia bacterium]
MKPFNTVIAQVNHGFRFLYIVKISLANGKTKQFKLSTPEATIGRSSKNDIVIKDKYVSRHHATLKLNADGTFSLEAVKDYNGIEYKGEEFLNIDLKPNQEVTIGSTQFSIKIPSLEKTEMANVYDGSDLFLPEHKNDSSSSAEDSEEYIITDRLTPEDYDDDEDDIFTAPTFSMRDKLLKENTKIPTQGELVWEVIRYNGEQVFECTPMIADMQMNIFGKKGPKIKIDSKGNLFISKDINLLCGEDIDSDNYETIVNKLPFDGNGWTQLNQSSIILQYNGLNFFIRQTRLSPIQLAKLKKSLPKKYYGLSIALTALHLIAIMGLSFFSAQTPIEKKLSQEELNRFAQIAIATPQPTPKPKKVVQEVKPEKKITVPSKTKTHKITKRTSKSTVRHNQKVSRQVTKVPDISQVGALGKLGGTGMFSKTNSASNQLLAAVSNVSAVRANGGMQTFSVSGNIGGMPGKDVRMAEISRFKGGKGGSPQGNGFGSTSVGAKTGRKIQGKVVDISPPPGDVGVRGGGLTRAEIAKVVQSHLSEIRYCYEKGLLQDPSLSGKIVAKWTINPSGSVSDSGIKSSSVRNASVHSCLTGEITSWGFPKPRNGASVLVTFPFVFNSSNF